MKIIRNSLVVVLLFMVAFANAQQVEYNGQSYKVKGEKIYLNKEDVTNNLSNEDQINIKNAFSQKVLANQKIKEANKAAKKAAKEQKRAERKAKKAEKERRKAEKKIKDQAKAKERFEKSQRKFEKASDKFNKLKKDGHLSPNDELKWQKKLKGLQKDIEKYKAKSGQF